MNVKEYFEKAFPAHSYQLSRDPDDLASMPLDSPCGDDCRKAIDKAKALDDLIREGHGRFYPNHHLETLAIGNIAVNLCGLYICG